MGLIASPQLDIQLVIKEWRSTASPSNLKSQQLRVAQPDPDKISKIARIGTAPRQGRTITTAIQLKSAVFFNSGGTSEVAQLCTLAEVGAPRSNTAKKLLRQ